MKYYAAGHHYGIEVANDYATLYRFGSKAERDQFVVSKNWHEIRNGNLKTEEVTRDEARRHFPNAFRTTELHYDADSRDWLPLDDETGEYWSIDNIYEH